MKKRRVAILTFHKSLNYGSALQSWALQQVLIRLGLDTEILDYEPDGYHILYDKLWAPNSLTHIKDDVLHLIWLRFLSRREQDFHDFSAKYFKLSPKHYSSRDNLSEYAREKDILICGSDQIWNVKARDFDLNYFLPDIQIKKIAYSVSLGTGDLAGEQNAAQIRSWIMDFHRVSVREEAGAGAIRKFLKNQKDVSVTLDPTLLLDKKDYEEIISLPAIQAPYIFFYSVSLNASALDAAVRISKQLNMPVFTLIAGKGRMSYLWRSRRIRLAKGDCGPIGFLNLIQNADYVITDSFHGTSFSLIFEKRFLALNTSWKKGHYKNDERIRNILKKVELMNHYVEADRAMAEQLTASIDYEQVTQKRMHEAEASISFLKESVL